MPFNGTVEALLRQNLNITDSRVVGPHDRPILRSTESDVLTANPRLLIGRNSSEPQFPWIREALWRSEIGQEAELGHFRPSLVTAGDQRKSRGFPGCEGIGVDSMLWHGHNPRNPQSGYNNYR